MTTDDEEILKQTVIDEIAAQEPEPEKTLEELLQEKKALERKKRIIRFFIFCFLALFSFAVYWGLRPFQGTLPYGICKTFLELNVPYPETLHVSEAYALRDGSIKIWYAHTDAFGEYRMEFFKCLFLPDPKTGAMSIEKIEHNRIEMDPEKVFLYNHAIPYLTTNPPDLSMPKKLPDSLKDLQIDVNRFRKPIL
jgi:hypothetical protein